LNGNLMTPAANANAARPLDSLGSKHIVSSVPHVAMSFLERRLTFDTAPVGCRGFSFVKPPRAKRAALGPPLQLWLTAAAARRTPMANAPKWLAHTLKRIMICGDVRGDVGLRGVLSPCQDASLRGAAARPAAHAGGPLAGIRPGIARSVKAGPWSEPDLPDQGLFVRHSHPSGPRVASLKNYGA